MKLLVVTPDYVSHYFPLSAVGRGVARRDVEVVVATGTALRERVVADGFVWRQLRMSRGSNAGIAGAPDPDDDLADFFAATRRGMVATLRQQAQARQGDLLWRPDTVARDVVALVDDVAPDAIVVDHLSFAATMALRAAGRAFTTFVPGHPSQLPLAGEVYGYPVAWPDAITVDESELASLRLLCERVAERFTAQYNEALRALSPGAEPVDDAFAAHGADVLFNSPAELHDRTRHDLLPAEHAFLGSCVRDETVDPRTAAWLAAASRRPLVYASFGTFLSTRHDVLGRVVGALSSLDVAVALSTGSADIGALGPLPPAWLVAPTLPQVSVLGAATTVVTHGGNNTVTEAVTNGCPMVVLPFSTDQFAVAADVERAGLGVALDPNRAGVDDLAAAVGVSLGEPMLAAADGLAQRLARSPGPELAAERLLR